MIGIDWVAVGLLLVAYAFSSASRASLAVKNGVFAVALLAIAGWRLRSGAQGMNLVIVAAAVVLAVTYAARAFRSPR